MLARLFLFLLLCGVVYGGVRLWRTYRAGRAGMLDALEIKQLADLSKNSPRLAATMALRVQIVEATPEEGKREMSIRLDGAVRRLMRQEVLRKQITKNLSDGARDRLAERVADAQAAAEQAEDPDQRRQKESVVNTLESQLEQIERLVRRKSELEDQGDRMIAELKTIHMAMLEASSTEISLSEGRVGGLLKDLEETSEQLRQKVQAHDEVEKLLAVARQAERS